MPLTNSRTTRSSSTLAQPVQRKLTDALFKSTVTKRRDDVNLGKKPYHKQANRVSPSKKARTDETEDWSPEFEDIEIDNESQALKTPSTSALTGAELQRIINDDGRDDYDSLSDEQDSRQEQEVSEEFNLNLSTVFREKDKVIESKLCSFHLIAFNLTCRYVVP